MTAHVTSPIIDCRAIIISESFTNRPKYQTSWLMRGSRGGGGGPDPPKKK